MESKILSEYSDQEKGAYLGALASLATADHAASQEELDHISVLADAAGISETQKQKVLQAASDMSDDELQRCLNVLKNSELRFSLVTELITFAKSDGNYNEDEKNDIEHISQQLGINTNQFSLLDHFVNKSNGNSPGSEQPDKQGFLESLGLGNKFKEQGINMGGLGKGLLALAAPFLLGKLFGGRRTGGSRSPIGGAMGGGGLGSLLGMLSMGRGFGNTGGMLSRLLKGNRV